MKYKNPKDIRGRQLQQPEPDISRFINVITSK